MVPMSYLSGLAWAAHGIYTQSHDLSFTFVHCNTFAHDESPCARVISRPGRISVVRLLYQRCCIDRLNRHALPDSAFRA
jgi:hypothetical protein